MSDQGWIRYPCLSLKISIMISKKLLQHFSHRNIRRQLSGLTLFKLEQPHIQHF